MRKDGKSQYQVKKEKLQKIKGRIWWYKESWEALRKGDFTRKPPSAAEELEKIWEIVKDE